MKMLRIIIILMLSFNYSCSSDDFVLTGEYSLRSIENNCESNNTTYQDIKINGKYCLKKTIETTDSNGDLSVIEDIICNHITLQNSGIGVIISSNSSIKDTSQITYTELTDQIEICYTSTGCVTYDVINRNLVLSHDYIGTFGMECNTTATFEK